MSWRGKTFPTAKLTKIFENEGVTAKKIADYDTPVTPDTERAKPKVAIAGTMYQIESEPRIQPKVGAEARCMLSTKSLAKQELAIEAEWRRL